MNLKQEGIEILLFRVGVTIGSYRNMGGKKSREKRAYAAQQVI